MGEKGNPEIYEPGPIIGERGGELLQKTAEKKKSSATKATTTGKPKAKTGQS